LRSAKGLAEVRTGGQHDHGGHDEAFVVRKLESPKALACTGSAFKKLDGFRNSGAEGKLGEYTKARFSQSF
jgi:hypothetical protein